MNLLKEIIKKLEKAFTESVDNRGESTKIFHRTLAGLIENKGNLVAYSSSLENDPKKRTIKKEFLIDFCISIEDNYNTSFNSETLNYEGLILVCESEWDMNRASVIYDFQKLAVMKAKYKIMVYNLMNELTEEQLLKSVSPNLLGDDSYYILCYGQDEVKISVYFNGIKQKI